MNNINLENKQINSEKESFEDLRKQNVNPNKVDFNTGTLYQNFDKPRPEFDFTDNKINDKIREKIELVDKLDENINHEFNNNNEINGDKKNIENKFNSINSEKFNNNTINNNLNNINTDVNFDVNIINENKFENNNVREIDNNSEKKSEDEIKGYKVEDI